MVGAVVLSLLGSAVGLIGGRPRNPETVRDVVATLNVPVSRVFFAVLPLKHQDQPMCNFVAITFITTARVVTC